MKQQFGSSAAGLLADALRGISNPSLLILMSNANQFAAHVAELEERFPGVPSIGCIGMSYERNLIEKGVGVVAMSDGITATTGVLQEASRMPAKYLESMEQQIKAIVPGKNDTVCIDFCTGNDACVLTTIHSVLKNYGVSLVGGTGDGGKVSVNGVIYEDADAYAIIKNQRGKIAVYKENIYAPMPGYRFIASKTNRDKYYVGELNGRSAKQVYMEELGISEGDVVNQTFRNPFGKMNGNDVCIISIKEIDGGGLCCYRQVNDSDVLTLLEVQDYRKTVAATLEQIHRDFSRISGVFSINCCFRHLFFSQEHYFDDYLQTMASLGNHAGLVGFGEHYNQQFVNQTMTCVVFE